MKKKEKLFYDHTCNCGCGNRIEVQAHHNGYSIPRYIRGHNKGHLEHSHSDHIKLVIRNKLTHPKEIRTCENPVCGNTFECLLTSAQRFCSNSCSPAWNRGLTKETDPRIENFNLIGKTFEEIYGESRAKEIKQKLRKIATELFQDLECRRRQKENTPRGSNHPMWQGGWNNPYPPDFDSKLRESIRRRDNYQCQLCYKTQEETDRKLCIHHIDYDKENSDPKNLIALCGRCHSKMNSDREYWTDLLGAHNVQI